MISLAYLDRVAKGTVQPGPRQEAPINAIPLADVEPFLKNLRVVEDFDELPYVVGLEDSRSRATRASWPTWSAWTRLSPVSATQWCAPP